MTAVGWPWMTMLAYGWPRLPVADHDCPWLAMADDAWPWLAMADHGYNAQAWLATARHERQRLVMVENGQPWSPVGSHDRKRPRLITASHGWQWAWATMGRTSLAIEYMVNHDCWIIWVRHVQLLLIIVTHGYFII